MSAEFGEYSISNQRNSRLLVQKIIGQALNLSEEWVEGTKTFDSEMIFNVAILAALEKSSVEDISTDLRDQYYEKLEEKTLTAEDRKPPSPDVVLENFKASFDQISAHDIGKCIAKILQRLILILPQFRGNRIPRVELALDLHDEEYHGKTLFDMEGNRLVFRTKKHGKSKQALRYATLSIVNIDGNFKIPLTIGFGVNHIGQPRKEVIQQLLDQLEVPLRIDRLLMDGGFASQEIFEFLDQKGIKWICRGKYSSKTTYLGDVGDKQWFPYYIKDQYPVAGYLFRMKTPSGARETVLLLASRFWTPKPVTVKQIYRRRFRIENTYRHARVAKIKTSTRNIHLRWIFWAIAHFLELLWEIFRAIGIEEGFRTYSLRQKKFIRILRDVLESYYFVIDMG